MNESDSSMILVVIIIAAMFYFFFTPAAEQVLESCGDNKVIIDDECVCAGGYFPKIICVDGKRAVDHDFCYKCDEDGDQIEYVDGVEACNVGGMMTECGDQSGAAEAAAAEAAAAGGDQNDCGYGYNFDVHFGKCVAVEQNCSSVNPRKQLKEVCDLNTQALQYTQDVGDYHSKCTVLLGDSQQDDCSPIILNHIENITKLAGDINQIVVDVENFDFPNQEAENNAVVQARLKLEEIKNYFSQVEFLSDLYNQDCSTKGKRDTLNDACNYDDEAQYYVSQVGNTMQNLDYDPTNDYHRSYKADLDGHQQFIIDTAEAIKEIVDDMENILAEDYDEDEENGTVKTISMYLYEIKQRYQSFNKTLTDWRISSEEHELDT